MKYPKLKCEEKKNTKVCSVTLKKMKELRKKGFNYKQIGESLKISDVVVRYHISPLLNTLEYKENQRKYLRKYQRYRYKNDPEFRRKMLDSINKHHKDKYHNDPKFKKWADERSSKYSVIWYNKQKLKHPNWSSACINGAHGTKNYSSACKNKKGNCKCPCHK